MGSNKLSKLEVVLILITDIIISTIMRGYMFVVCYNGLALSVSKKDLLIRAAKYCMSFKFFLLLIINGLLLFVFFKFKDYITKFVYKYRYLLAIGVFLVCLIFEINGSSLGMWNQYLPNEKGVSDGVLLGDSRPIRTDEWAVNTPMGFSQYYGGKDSFSYFSKVIRGTSTDTFIVYGQAVKEVSMVFRPFYLGYLMFDQGRGLSFFWCGRLIALFMVTFELAMLITKKNKKLSVIMACLVSFAPVVQWWFAINGFVEMLVFGQLAVLMINKYMLTENYLKRFIYILVTFICAGGYILTFYPAWQVPFFYIFLALAIWVIVKDWSKFKFSPKRDILPIVIVAAGFLLIMGHIFVNSQDTIKAVLNTAYPGKRVCTGGGGIKMLFYYVGSTFLPFKPGDIPVNTNQCELSNFYDFFPLGILATLFVMIKEKKKDILLILLLIVTAILSLFLIFKWPVLLAKVSLLSFTTDTRAKAAVGFANTLLLIRAFSLMESKLSRVKTLIISFVLAVGITFIAKVCLTPYLESFLIAGNIVMLTALLYIVFNLERLKELAVIYICVFMVFIGGTVNPIRTGTGIIYNNDLGTKIENIVDKDSKGLWVVENMGSPMINYPIMRGAPTINCTNTYPDIKRWEKLDKTGSCNQIYNRYAHIVIKLTDEDTKFILGPNAVDVMTINLNVNDLSKLNIKYILSKQELDKYSNDNVRIKKVSQSSDYNIYKVAY